jgi:hypothetical protein
MLQLIQQQNPKSDSCETTSQIFISYLDRHLSCSVRKAIFYFFKGDVRLEDSEHFSVWISVLGFLFPVASEFWSGESGFPNLSCPWASRFQLVDFQTLVVRGQVDFN